MTAARPDTWMPMFWGDYARDTGHLNAAGHGAYLMLIKHYWCTGKPLADDDDELWRIACCDSKREWLKLRPKVVRLFRTDGGVLRHKRVEEELAKAESNVNKRAEAGRKGAQSRWQTDANANGNRNGNAMAEPPVRHRQNDGTSPSPSPVREEKSSEANASGAAAPAEVVESAEAQVFREGRRVLGKNAGGMLTNLRKSQGYDDTKALALIIEAEGKASPREWIGAVIRGEVEPPPSMDDICPPEIYGSLQ